jgi:acetyl esterase
MHSDRPRARRTADVALRDLAPPGRARVHWPVPGAEPCATALVVLFSPDDDLVDELAVRLGAVVLTAPAAHAAEAHAVVSWAADHAAELGADAARIVVVGDRAGAALAERVAELTLTEGWPPLRHVALIWPHDDPAAALHGLDRALARPDRSPR